MQRSYHSKSRIGWGLFLGLVAGTGAMSFLLFSWGDNTKSNAVLERTGDELNDGDEGNDSGPFDQKRLSQLIKSRRVSYTQEEPAEIDPAAEPPVYHPRDPEEWQGMLVDLKIPI